MAANWAAAVERDLAGDSFDRPADLLLGGQRDWARVLIVGGSGSGKTTSAAALSNRTGIGVVHLDEIADSMASDNQRAAAVEEIALSSRWICEGVQLGWADPLYARAQLILWLDIQDMSLVYRGLVRRFVTTSMGHTRATGWRGAFRPSSYFRHGLGFLHHLFVVGAYHGRTDSHQGGETRTATLNRLRTTQARVVRVTARNQIPTVWQAFTPPSDNVDPTAALAR